jgi:hypothetical protein
MENHLNFFGRLIGWDYAFITTVIDLLCNLEILFWVFRYALDLNGGYGWTRTTDLSIMSAAL